MKTMGHTSVWKGKRVMLFFHDGHKLVTRFIEKKGKFIITEAGKFNTQEVYNLAIYKK